MRVGETVRAFHPREFGVVREGRIVRVGREPLSPSPAEVGEGEDDQRDDQDQEEQSLDGQPEDDREDDEQEREQQKVHAGDSTASVGEQYVYIDFGVIRGGVFRVASRDIVDV